MMSLNHQHSNHEGVQSGFEHESLRMFDLHGENKSRIPVLVDRENVVKSDCSRSVSHRSKTNESVSKIPIFKASPTHFNEPIRSLPAKPATAQKQENKKTIKKRIRMISPETKQTDFKPKSRKTVKLQGLELTSIPTDIFNRTDLETLILSPQRETCLDFKLPFVPSAIGQMTQLKTLVLDTNELQDIPDEISNLHELETLVLGNNHLSQLPKGLKNLDRLKSLHLANNRFEEMPLSICHLASLRFLDISNNFLEKLPNEICLLAGPLHTLLLIMNEIKCLPKSFSLLTSLTCLWLGENNLSELPEGFGELYQLDWGKSSCSSNIDGNPLVRPPLEVCQKGPLEIRKYFHQLSQETETVIAPTSMKNVTVKTKPSFKPHKQYNETR